jgi:hypothetical protein
VNSKEVNTFTGLGARYFDASVLRRVAEVGRGKTPSDRILEVPVGRY